MNKWSPKFLLCIPFEGFHRFFYVAFIGYELNDLRVIQFANVQCRPMLFVFSNNLLLRPHLSPHLHRERDYSIVPQDYRAVFKPHLHFGTKLQEYSEKYHQKGSDLGSVWRGGGCYQRKVTREDGSKEFLFTSVFQLNILQNYGLLGRNFLQHGN